MKKERTTIHASALEEAAYLETLLAFVQSRLAPGANCSTTEYVKLKQMRSDITEAYHDARLKAHGYDFDADEPCALNAVSVKLGGTRRYAIRTRPRKA